MSNKLLFNNALLKKDFKILFPLFCANLIMSIMVYPLRYMQLIIKLRDTSLSEFELNNIIYEFSRTDEVYGYSIILIFISIIVAIMLFANEKNKKTIEIVAAAPFSRKQIYVNKIFIGLFVSIIPVIVTYLISYGILSSDKLISSLVNMHYIKQAFISLVLAQLVVFSYYIMVSMLFGSVVSTLVCGTIFTFFPAAFADLLNDTVNIFSNDIMNMFAKITPFIRLICSIEEPIYGNIYMMLMSALFIIAGYFLFEMYKMEKNSEFLTFKWTESVFRVGVLISSALLCSSILNMILFNVSGFEVINRLLGMIVGAALGYFIPRALILRNKQA